MTDRAKVGLLDRKSIIGNNVKKFFLQYNIY